MTIGFRRLGSTGGKFGFKSPGQTDSKDKKQFAAKDPNKDS